MKIVLDVFGGDNAPEEIVKGAVQACKEFNDKFGLTGTSKAIDVKLRSDLYNIIKENESIVKDYESEEVDNG